MTRRAGKRYWPARLAAALATVVALNWPAGGVAAPAPLALLEARAAAADGEAMFELALRHEHAEGVARDYARATLLYCRAVVLGHAGAAYQLGLMRLYGRGIERDEGSAMSWLGRAAAGGHPHAARLLERVRGEARPDATTCPPPPPPPAAMRLAKAPKEIADAIRRLAPKYGLDPALVTAVVAAESGFVADAVSPKNAQGLMQLIPATATRFGVADSFDPVQNLRGGMGYLRWLLQRFDGDVTLTLAAYNAGEGAVQQYGGVPPYPETQQYVARIRSHYDRRQHPVASR